MNEPGFVRATSLLLHRASRRLHPASLCISTGVRRRDVAHKSNAAGGVGLRHLKDGYQKGDRAGGPKILIRVAVGECGCVHTEVEFQRIHEPFVAAQVLEQEQLLAPGPNVATPLSHASTIRTWVRGNNLLNS